MHLWKRQMLNEEKLHPENKPFKILLPFKRCYAFTDKKKKYMLPLNVMVQGKLSIKLKT